MRIFIAADQTMVNLDMVTHINIAKSEGKHILRINFSGGTARELLFSGERSATTEYDAFVAAMSDEHK